MKKNQESNDNSLDIKDTLIKVLELTKEKGYMEINQMVAFLATEDPTYIPSVNGARDLLTKFDRDDYLQVLVKEFYENNKKGE